MGAEASIDVLGPELAGTWTILRPVCVVAHSYIVLGTDVRGEAHEEQNDQSTHDSILDQTPRVCVVCEFAISYLLSHRLCV